MNGPQRARPHGLVAVALLLSGLGTVGAGVRVDRDPDVVFQIHRTFSFMEGTPAQVPSAEARIHAAVRAEFEARGVQEIGEEPSLLVVTHAAVGGGPWVLDPDNFKYGGYPQQGWGASGGSGQGVLIVDILLADSKRLVWRGLATAKVPADEGRLHEAIDRMVRKLFKRYPV